MDPNRYIARRHLQNVDLQLQAQLAPGVIQAMKPIVTQGKSVKITVSFPATHVRSKTGAVNIIFLQGLVTASTVASPGPFLEKVVVLQHLDCVG
jgi:hypothetical protein